MSKKELDGVTVFWAVLGALLAAWLIQGIAGLILTRAALYGFTLEMDNAFKSSVRTESKGSAIAPAREFEYRPGEQEVISVPGQSVEDCNAVTSGVINEAWKKCRQGRTIIR